jgi:hypothetical protein
MSESAGVLFFRRDVRFPGLFLGRLVGGCNVDRCAAAMFAAAAQAQER